MHANPTTTASSVSSPSAGPLRNRFTAPPPARRSILIVDDNPEKTLALQSIVEELDYRIVIARSADAALRELLKQDFVLALLDVHMPGMDGFELAELIRSRPAHQNLAIVFMSAMDQTDDRLENAYRLGAIDFIALPARRPVIKAKLASLLGLQEKTHRLELFADESARFVERSDQRFRLLLEHAEDVAIFFLDARGVVAEWSRGAEIGTGWSTEEIVGREFAVFFVPGDIADRVPQDLLASARDGRHGMAERWLARKDGTRFWARFCVVALGVGGDAGFGVLLRDTTGQKNAEQELQIKAEVLESMAESVCVVDDELRIVYANPAACRTFGYDGRELTGADVRILNDYPPEEHGERVSALLAHFEHSRHWTGEWHNRRKDGSSFLTHTRVSAFVHHGARYFVCVQEDLTRRKDAEAALQRNTELQEIVAELEAFSYSVSHDLKSPLRTVRGFADAVIQDYGEALQGPGVRYMQRIRHATERLEKMIEEILTVSRLSRDALPLSPVNLNHVLASILEDSPSFRLPEAEIVVVPPLPVVRGHEPSLHQVLINLIANAVKFVPPERRPYVVVRADVDGEHARVWVEDNGIGVKPEEQERIFRAFQRAETSLPFAGNGVGLAMVKRTIERLGGTVGLRSLVGEGSQFWIRLPLAGSG